MIVTSVSRRPQALADAPASIHVITGGEIRAAGARTLPAAERAGLDVSSRLLAIALNVQKSGGLSEPAPEHYADYVSREQVAQDPGAHTMCSRFAICSHVRRGGGTVAARV